MSILEQQLAQRAKGGVLLNKLEKQRVPLKPSLLFDKQKAETLDNETIYGLGVNGLMELRKHDERFAAFEETLFSATAKDMSRLMQTKEVNKQLDKSIEHFLILLSPYFLLKPAQKALEWLIRRFR